MPGDPAAWVEVLCLALLVAGFALVAASWTGRAPQRLGWAGLWLGVAGALGAWIEPLATKLAVLAIGAIAIALQWRPGRRAGGGPFGLGRSAPFRPWDHEAELLRLCHGDRAMKERLIAHELERKPELSRAGAALAAATRLKHDKR